MNSQDPNPYEPSTKIADADPVASAATRDRVALTGLELTLIPLFASVIVAVLVGLDIFQIHWKSDWPYYWFFVCGPATVIGWIISTAACVRRRTKLTVVGVIVGFLAVLLTAALCLGLIGAAIVQNPV